MRRQNRRRRDPSKERMARRRDAVWAYLDEVIDAILTGEPARPRLDTDSPEVDRQIADLVVALEAEYRRGAAAVREAAPVAPAEAKR